MGTRSLTHIEENGKILVTIYRQFDGYVDGHGHKLAKILSGKRIVNGYGADLNVFNGMGCLAAQVIHELKDGVGNVYIYPAGSEDCGEEYTYFVSGKVGEESNVRILAYNKEIFNGSATELLTFEEVWEDE